MDSILHLLVVVFFTTTEAAEKRTSAVVLFFFAYLSCINITGIGGGGKWGLIQDMGAVLQKEEVQLHNTIAAEIW